MGDLLKIQKGLSSSKGEPKSSRADEEDTQEDVTVESGSENFLIFPVSDFSIF